MKIDFFHRDKKLFCYLSVDEMFNNAPAISGSILAEPSIFHPFDSKAALPFDEKSLRKPKKDDAVLE